MDGLSQTMTFVKITQMSKLLILFKADRLMKTSDRENKESEDQISHKTATEA